MKDKSLHENFSELSGVVKSYIDARINLWKVHLLENVTKAGVYLLTFILIWIASLFILLLLAFGFSFWYEASNFGPLSEGFLLSAGFFVLLALLVFLLRKKLFANHIVKNIAPLIFNEDKKEA